MILSPSISGTSDIRQAWVQYILSLPARIGTPYEYVGHFTYRDAEEINPHHAAAITTKRFGYFVHLLNTHLYGNRYKRRGEGVWGAIATELSTKGYPHHHAILGGAELRRGIKRLELMDMWDESYGIARVTDYRGEAAARYLTKYITKQADAVIDVFAPPRVREQLRTA